ncbi:MAG: hypothetical protein LBF12_03375 [Christensenellaceae bacterium]|jgi:cell division protein FtsW (lipid II flippase)|nr:hypothetical protein [Christensenellaceae bacterium]
MKVFIVCLAAVLFISLIVWYWSSVVSTARRKGYSVKKWVFLCMSMPFMLLVLKRKPNITDKQN